MSEYSSGAPPQNNSQAATFAVALQRARLIAAKIDKRPLEDGQEPSAKKFAGPDQSGDYQSPMGCVSRLSPVFDSDFERSSIGSGVGGAGGRIPPGPGGQSQQMPPEQTINEYIRVPDKMVGLIIGRGGEHISRVQAESGCKIQMAPDSGGQPDRICTLTGSREAVSRAKEMVNAIVNQRGRDGGPPDNGPPQQRMGQGGGGQNSEEIMVPGPKVGLIIGKGGETIKQLQEKSGAKMVVIQEGPNPEYEKPLRITGDPQKVEYAKQLVYELIAEKEMQYGGSRGGPGKSGNQQHWGGGEDFDQQGGSEGHEVLVPRAAVGVVIGKGGDMIKKIQAETGARVQFHQEHEEVPGDRRCILQGKIHQVEQARQMITDLIDSVNRREQDGGRQSGPRGPPRNGESGGPSYGNWGGGQDNQIEVSFTVSNVKCGVIIGRGGEVIKQINAQSGAHCVLDRRTQNNRGNRTFYIRGEPENVETAKRIITEKAGMAINFIESTGQSNNGGNGGGGGGNGNGGSGDYSGGYGGGQNAPTGGGGGVGGGNNSGVAMWSYNPQWHPSQHQQQQQEPQQQQQQPVPINPVTGQPDYSQQWIEYYRSMGCETEAKKIEQQQSVGKPTGGVNPQQSASQHPQTVVSSNGGGATTAAVTNVSSSGPADYSAQWAEYYRSMGKIKEAEAIESTMKQKAAVASATGQSNAGAYGAGAPYQPQPYQQHYPSYGPYPGYPQSHPAPPDQQ